MAALFRRVWADDRGAVLSVEMILILTILVFGMIPGIIALRNGVNSALTSAANLFIALSPTFSFSNTANGPVIIVGATGTAGSFLSASQLPPIELPETIVVPSAP